MVMFTDHAKDKLLNELRKLGITERLIAEIIKDPDELLYDALRERFVAISWSHNTAVVYERTRGGINGRNGNIYSELKVMVNRRKRTGRWI